jgi:hypothetical protein
MRFFVVPRKFENGVDTGFNVIDIETDSYAFRHPVSLERARDLLDFYSYCLRNMKAIPGGFGEMV